MALEDEKMTYPVNEVLFTFTFINSCLMSFFTTLIPSFLRRSPHTGAPKKLRPTAYLDGLRGVASFIVFIHHTIIDWYPSLSSGYASADPHNTSYIMQMPIIRVIYSGRGMVSVFFVISGYALSYKAIRLMHSNQYANLLDALASSTFRRAMRLFFPITISTFISMLVCRAGWYRQDPLRHNVIPQIDQRGFYSQLHDWWAHVLLVSNPFVNVDGRTLYSPPYDGHLWTIPIEYHGSIIVFVTLLCIAKLKPLLRLLFLAGLVWYSLWIAHWEVFLFLSGTLFCELNFAYTNIITSLTLDSFTTPPKSRFRLLWATLLRLPSAPIKLLFQLVTTALFILAIHILSFPDENAASSPGYMRMISLTPHENVVHNIEQRFWLAIGAFILLLAMLFNPFLQRPFTTWVAQYLGRISFALYIVHGPILYTLGIKMLIPPYTALEAARESGDLERLRGTSIEYAWSAAGAWVVDLVVCVWAADVFWREVDARSVSLAGWIAGKCWVKS
jgi:peptidoglycan/LPS O-acetylase OafA/YrhL